MYLAHNAHVMAFLLEDILKPLRALDKLRKANQLSVTQYARSIAKLEARCDKLEMSEIRYEFECQEALDRWEEAQWDEDLIDAINADLLSKA